MDDLDRRILEILQREGRTTNVDLAEKLSVSPSSALRRVRPLEESGVIRGYVALLNPERVGMTFIVFITVTLEKQTKESVEQFEKSISRWPEVTECHLMAGDNDYLIRAVLRDRLALERFLIERLGALSGIARIRTGIPLRQVKYTTVIPISRN